MKIVFYCQHVLGIGHYFRSLEICEALHGHDVVLVTGGPRPDVEIGGHIREVELPGLMMDSQFSGLFAADKDKAVDDVQAERRKILFELIDSEKPDVFMVELYPFGRKAFRFELDPVLEHIKNNARFSCRAVCSLRDILVEKNDPEKYETRVVDVLNRWFDALFVHSDPAVLSLDETFSRVAEIRIPVVYTGFVTSKPPPDARLKIRRTLWMGEDEKLVVASAGGGKVGAVLLEAAAKALKILSAVFPVRGEIFTGPFLDQAHFDKLKGMEDDLVKVRRFTNDFLSYLSAADLSVSMAGYNTCMNILACKTPAAVWPFPQNREQRLRAERLAEKAPITVLEADDLACDCLAGILSGRLLHKNPPADSIDLDGSYNTARSLIQMFDA